MNTRQLQITCLIEQAVEDILNGGCVVDCEGETDFYIFHASSSIGRSITEPINEKVFGGIDNMIRGMREAVIALAGFELLFMVYPQVRGKDGDILKTMLISYTFVTLFYVLIILSCFMFFSPVELSIIPEPVLYMLKAFSFRIVERSDLLFLSLWVVIVMTSIVNYIFLASTGISQILKTGNSSKVTLLVSAACLLIALLPHNFLFISKLNKWFSYFAMVMIYLLPIPLLLLSILRGRRKASE